MKLKMLVIPIEFGVVYISKISENTEILTFGLEKY